MKRLLLPLLVAAAACNVGRDDVHYIVATQTVREVCWPDGEAAPSLGKVTLKNTSHASFTLEVVSKRVGVAGAQEITLFPGEEQEVDVVGLERFEGNADLSFRVRLSDQESGEARGTYVDVTYTNTACAPDPGPGPGPGPGPQLESHDTSVPNPQIPSVAEQGLPGLTTDPVIVIPGGEPRDGALVLANIATGGVLWTFLAPGFGNPQQFMAHLGEDAGAPADQQYFLNTLDLYSSWFNGGFGLNVFKGAPASDLNVLGLGPNGLAETWLEAVPSLRQVREYSPNQELDIVLSSFDFLPQYRPVSVARDPVTGDYYILVKSEPDNRALLYRRRAGGGGIELVHSGGLGGVHVRIAGDTLVVTEEESEVVSLFRRQADDSFAHDRDIANAGPVRGILVRERGGDVEVVWSSGPLHFLRVAADGMVTGPVVRPAPEGFDRVAGLAFWRSGGLVGTGTQGDQGKWFVTDDYARDFELDLGFPE